MFLPQGGLVMFNLYHQGELNAESFKKLKMIDHLFKDRSINAQIDWLYHYEEVSIQLYILEFIGSIQLVVKHIN